jgi:ankyrin repeat protein
MTMEGESWSLRESSMASPLVKTTLGNPHTLYALAKANDFDAVEGALDDGADPRDEEERHALSGSTALHAAAQFGYDELIVLLSERSPETLRAINNQGHLPTHVAAFSGQLRALQLLVGYAPSTLFAKTHEGVCERAFL